MRLLDSLPHPREGLIRLLAISVVLMALLPVTAIGVGAQGSASITVHSLNADGSEAVPFAQFTVTDSNGTVYGPIEATWPLGEAIFVVEPGEGVSFTVSENQPPTCGIQPPDQDIGVIGDGEAVEVTFNTEFDASCGLGSIAVTTYGCPDGFAADGADHATFAASCVETMDGVTFVLEHDGDDNLALETGALGIPGRAAFPNLVPGDYRLSSDIPLEVATDYAFCVVDGADEYQASFENPGWKTSFGLTDNADVDCDWYSVPVSAEQPVDEEPVDEEPVDEEPVDEGEEPEDDGGDIVDVAATGSIEIHKAGCPAGYDAGNYFEDCHGNGIDGVLFTIEGPNGYANDGLSDTIEDPGPGVVFFADLEAGTYEIDEDIPGDVNDTFIYCSDADTQETIDFAPTDVGGIALDLGADQHVICDWYNIPVQQFDPSTIEIVKYTCPAGFDGGNASFQDFVDDCTEGTNGVTFFLTQEGAVEPQSSTTGDPAPFTALFTDLPPSFYQLSEDVPDEFATPYAFCSVDGGEVFQADTSDGNAYFELDGTGQEVACNWYNVPEDLQGSSSVEIHKAICPAGYNGGNYFDDCHDEGLDAVGFTMSSTNGFEEYGETDVVADPGPGILVFSDLVAATYTIQEHVPAGIEQYVVYCSDADTEEPVDFDYHIPGAIDINLGQDQQVICDWYNVPEKEEPTFSGTITVHKFLCQGKQNNQYNWATDCDPYVDGADFRLSTKAGDPLVNGTTNAEGTLLFFDLADGTYKLEETSGDWCHAEADLVDAAGNVIVANGGNTDVFIYNCTAKVSLPNTGAGPSGTGPLGGIGLAWYLAAGLTLAAGIIAVCRRPALALRRAA